MGPSSVSDTSQRLRCFHCRGGNTRCCIDSRRRHRRFTDAWLDQRSRNGCQHHRVISTDTRVADGDLDIEIDSTRTDEFGDLADSIEQMRVSLRDRLSEMEAARADLEQAQTDANEAQAEAEAAEEEAKELATASRDIATEYGKSWQPPTGGATHGRLPRVRLRRWPVVQLRSDRDRSRSRRSPPFRTYHNGN